MSDRFLAEPEVPRRHPVRWLAAAVAVAALVGAGIALATDDGPGVTAGPDGTTPLTAPPATYGASTPCPFTLQGDPVQLHLGHVAREVFDTEGAPSTFDHTVMSGHLNDQPVEISIPGQVVTDLAGERVDDIELARGTAQLWLTDGFVQVRWFPGGDARCGSFTVTVFGPNPDLNRHAAVDFADRVVLPTG